MSICSARLRRPNTSSWPLIRYTSVHTSIRYSYSIVPDLNMWKWTAWNSGGLLCLGKKQTNIYKALAAFNKGWITLEYYQGNKTYVTVIHEVYLRTKNLYIQVHRRILQEIFNEMFVIFSSYLKGITTLPRATHKRPKLAKFCCM